MGLAGRSLGYRVYKTKMVVRVLESWAQAFV